MSKWPKTNFEKKVFLKMVLRLRFLQNFIYITFLSVEIFVFVILLVSSFTGNLSAKILTDHRVQVRAGIEAWQQITVIQICMNRELGETLEMVISVPHTEETPQHHHQSRDVRFLAQDTKWPHRLHQENLRLHHGNLVLPDIHRETENHLKDLERTRTMKVF